MSVQRTSMTFSRKVTLASLVLWAISLLLPGFSIYSGDEVVYGLQILLMGWGSIFIGNAAWYANIFYLFGAAGLFWGDAKIVAPIIAAILCLDIIRFDTSTGNSIGSTTPVFGLGWGAIIWMIAIFLLLYAAGTQRLERKRNKKGIITGHRLSATGLILVSLTLVYAIFFSTYERLVANEDELKRLSPVAFKIKKVCSDSVKLPEQSLSDFNGILELVEPQRFAYPFGNIKDLLNDGIPTIQSEGRYYFLQNGVMVSEPSKNKASASLYHRNKEAFTDEGHQSIISTKLIENKTQRIVFDQKWIKENHGSNTNIYCPDYDAIGFAHKNPTALLLNALNIRPDTKKIQKPPMSWFDVNRYDAKISNIKINITKEQGVINSEDSKTHWRNKNCPSSIGWGERDTLGKVPFMLGKNSYYEDTLEYGPVFCKGSDIYIGKLRKRSENPYLFLSKRSTDGFDEQWKLGVRISNTILEKRGKYSINNIEEYNGGLKIKFYEKNSDAYIDIDVPFQ